MEEVSNWLEETVDIGLRLCWIEFDWFNDLIWSAAAKAACFNDKESNESGLEWYDNGAEWVDNEDRSASGVWGIWDGVECKGRCPDCIREWTRVESAVLEAVPCDNSWLLIIKGRILLLWFIEPVLDKVNIVGESVDVTQPGWETEVNEINWALPVGELAAEQEPMEAFPIGGELVLDIADETDEEDDDAKSVGEKAEGTAAQSGDGCPDISEDIWNRSQ